MKKFMFLSYGFVTPTPEIMEAWGKWFETMGDKIIEGGHFPMGREISENGTKELPLDMEAITGYCIFKAESLDAAMSIAQACPYIASNRVYEIQAQG